MVKRLSQPTYCLILVDGQRQRCESHIFCVTVRRNHTPPRGHTGLLAASGAHMVH